MESPDLTLDSKKKGTFGVATKFSYRAKTIFARLEITESENQIRRREIWINFGEIKDGVPAN